MLMLPTWIQFLQRMDPNYPPVPIQHRHPEWSSGTSLSSTHWWYQSPSWTCPDAVSACPQVGASVGYGFRSARRIRQHGLGKLPPTGWSEWRIWKKVIPHAKISNWIWDTDLYISALGFTSMEDDGSKITYWNRYPHSYHSQHICLFLLM